MATWCTVVEFLSFFWSLHAPFVAGLSEWLQRITCQCLLTNDNKSVLLPLLPSLHVTWIPYAQVDELAFLHPDHLREKESLVQNVNLILINEDVHQLFPLTLRFCRWVHPFVQTKQASWMCACFFVMHWSWMFHLWTPFGQLCSHSFFFNLIQTETKAQMLNLKAPTTIWTLAHDIKLVLSVSHVACFQGTEGIHVFELRWNWNNWKHASLCLVLGSQVPEHNWILGMTFPPSCVVVVMVMKAAVQMFVHHWQFFCQFMHERAMTLLVKLMTSRLNRLISFNIDSSIRICIPRFKIAMPQFAYNWLHTECPHAGLTGSWLIHKRHASQHVGLVATSPTLHKQWRRSLRTASKTKQEQAPAQNNGYTFYPPNNA